MVDRAGMRPGARTELCREAERRGWTLVRLRAGDDYPEIDGAADELHADVVAFAGADRAQSKAASVASGRELPFACVPAGLNSVFAREVGVDPSDGVRALAGLDDYCEYSVDLAEVNGVIFVNYVALGLDCTPVRVPSTIEPSALTFTSLPAYMVSWQQPPAQMHWFPSGARESCAGVFVSNNRRRFESSAIGGRTRLDGGVLGVGVIARARRGAETVDRDARWRELRTRSFELDAGAPLRADVDGRPLWLHPPVRFRVLPRALRVRIPRPP
jgi:diacylglycerol kinase family enzyme